MSQKLKGIVKVKGTLKIELVGAYLNILFILFVNIIINIESNRK